MAQVVLPRCGPAAFAGLTIGRRSGGRNGVPIGPGRASGSPKYHNLWAALKQALLIVFSAVLQLVPFRSTGFFDFAPARGREPKSQAPITAGYAPIDFAHGGCAPEAQPAPGFGGPATISSSGVDLREPLEQPLTDESWHAHIIFARNTYAVLQRVATRNDRGAASALRHAIALTDYLETAVEQGGRILIDRDGRQNELVIE